MTITLAKLQKDAWRIHTEAMAVGADNERLHALEDNLHVLALTTIAHGGLTADKARVIADIALSTLGLDFNRWCA